MTPLAAEAAPDFFGIPIGAIGVILAAVFSYAASRYSTRQSRSSSHDQVVTQTAAIMQKDNEDLREELKDHRAELRAATKRIGQLETALRDAGIQIPPEA